MKKYFLPIIILLISATFLGIGVIPTFNNYRRASRLLKDKQKNRDQLASKLDSLKNIDEFQQEQELQFSLQSLPVLAPYGQTLTLLEELSQTHNITISGLEIRPRSEAISLEFSVSGEMSQVQEFARVLNQSLLISVTDSIKLVKPVFSDQEASASASYKADLEVDFKFKSMPKTIGKVADPLPVITADLEQLLAKLREFNSITGNTSLTLDQVPSDRAPKLFPE